MSIATSLRLLPELHQLVVYDNLNLVKFPTEVKFCTLYKVKFLRYKSEVFAYGESINDIEFMPRCLII